MIKRFTPVLHFKDKENFFPVDVSYHLNNSILKMRYWEDVYLIDDSPTYLSIADYPEDNYYLDNKLSIEELRVDYANNIEKLGYTIYARVTEQHGFIVIQYWFFYAFNDAPLNHHEGDWECVTILLDRPDTPLSAIYTQHTSGQKASWSDVKTVDKTHPIVYIARGSHANYFRPYQGRLGSENDDVGADGITLMPADMKVILLENNDDYNNSTQSWLRFGGRWGDWAKLTDVSVGYAGPYGPGKGENVEKWHNPIDWAQEVKTIDRNWLLISWFVANFMKIFLVIAVFNGIYKIRKIAILQRREGLKLLELLRTNARTGIFIGFIGMVLSLGGAFLPWYLIKADIQTSIIRSEGTIDLLVLDGIRGAQINLLNEGGLLQVFNIGISFWILIFAGFILGLLDIIGVDSAKKLGNKFLRSGIIFFILILPIVVFVWQIISDLPNFATNMGFELTPEVINIANTVAGNPLHGASFFHVENFGSVYLEWGLQLGTCLFIMSALLRILCGLMLRKRSSEEKT